MILNYSEILWEQGSWDQEQVYLKVPKWWWVIQRPVRFWEQLCKVGICLQRLNVSKFNQFWYSDNRCQACLAWYELVMSYFMWWERDTCDISAELSRNLWSSETKIVTLELHQNKLEPEYKYIKCPLWLLRSNPRFLHPISTCILYCIESHQPLIQTLKWPQKSWWGPSSLHLHRPKFLQVKCHPRLQTTSSSHKRSLLSQFTEYPQR